MLSLAFPNIDPVLVEIGPIAIRWYALSYIFGIFLGWTLVGRLNRRANPPLLNEKAFDDLLMWGVVGVLLGGRLGYVMFYNGGYYAANPGEIAAVWKGGMSFHGGLLGVIFAMWLFARLRKIPYFRLMDMLAVATPIGLFLGRCANFINGELYGRIASPDFPLGVIFPGDPFARHPSQLYEAGLEGIVLFAILLTLALRTKALEKVGMLSGVFLTGYACFRFIVEFFREPDPQIGMLLDMFTMGQVLCVPMLLLGLFLIGKAQCKTRT